jgi:hypothetical protein
MATMMEHGSSLDNPEVLIPFNAGNIDEHEVSIRNWLALQPGSLEPLTSVEGIVDLIGRGFYQGWIIVEDNVELGIVIFSIQQYMNARTAKLEFLSCQNFHLLAKYWPGLEHVFRESGFDYVEAVTHPTIAEYAMKKMDFAVPSVYIRKPLQYTRTN